MSNPLVLLAVSFAAAILLAAAVRLSAPSRQARRAERRRLIAEWDKRRADDDEFRAVVALALRQAARDAEAARAGLPGRMPARDPATADEQEGT